MNLPRKLAVTALASALLFLALEGAASLVVAVKKPADSREEIREAQHCEYDAELGWMHQPNLRVEGLYGPGTVLTTSAQRFRAARVYTPEVPAGRYRVICLGDSFTMGYGVGDRDTFPAQLAALSERLEVINMGLGGFGIDQDYLWFMRDGLQFDADLLLFLVIPDDFARTQTGDFLGRYPKPVLEVRGGELVAGNVPLPRTFGEARSASVRDMLRRLRLYRLFGRKGGEASPSSHDLSAFDELARRVFVELRDTCRERGTAFAVVYLPPGPLYANGEIVPPVLGWLEQLLAAEDIPFHDLTPAFGAIPPAKLGQHFSQKHYSPAGNRLVAAALAQIVARDFDRGEARGR